MAKDKNFWHNLSQKAYPLTKGRFRIPISLEPFLISEKEYDNLQNNLELVISAAKKIADRYFNDKDLQKIVILNKKEGKLIERFKNEDFSGILRLDLFYGKKPKLVEINSDFPDGFFMHDVTSQEILSCLGVGVSVAPSHADLFHQLLAAQGLAPKDHIFIGYDKERTFIDEFELAKIKLGNLGWENISVGPLNDLKYKNRAFYFNNKPIDAIRRGIELFKLRKIPGLVEKLNSDIKIINNFKMRLLGHKSLLAALWDKRFHKYLSKKEIGAIKDLLPRTIKLNKRGIKSIISHKDKWVLKPSDLAEGKNVYVGSSLSGAHWAGLINFALKNPDYWILQRKVFIPKERFNLVDHQRKEIISGTRKYDFNPHFILFKDKIKMGIILVRFSESEVLNVAKGGGLTYAFVRDLIF